MFKTFRKLAGNRWVGWSLCLYLVSALAAPAQPGIPRPARSPSAPSRGQFMQPPAARNQQQEEEEQPAARSSSRGRSKLISLNFRDAPLDQVLTFYAELTGRTMIKSPSVNATITLRGQSRLTQEEALIAIDAVLAMHNITLVPMGEKFYKVVQTASARQDGMPIEGHLPEGGFADTDKLVSQLIELKYMTIADVTPVIQSLLHNYGKIQALERINSLLITDTSANLQRIMEILAFIDRPVEMKMETRVYELRYAEAGKISGRLNELIQESQADSKEETPKVAPPSQQRTPPGVIRARQAQQQQATTTLTPAELAERGIIQGKVKIVADDRTNILIVISEPQNFIFFDKIVAVLDRPVEPDIIVRVVALEYADAEEISGILNTFIGAASEESKKTSASGGGEEGETNARSKALEDFVQKRAEARQAAVEEAGDGKIGRLSSSTKILADKRTNSLLLMGRKSDISALEAVISQLDVMLGQVLIEAVILEVSLSKDLSYGVDWLQRSYTVYSEDSVGPGRGITVRDPVMSFGGGWNNTQTSFKDASTIDRSVELSAGALTYYLTFFDLNLDAIIRAAASSSDARVLSTPVVMTTDNTEAKIVAGQERPIVTSTTTSSDTAAQTSHYEYKNIGLELTVTPRINPQRFVVMEVQQTADNLLDPVQIDGNDVPVISKREISASIAVQSRQTIVLGGLVNQERRKGRSKVPLLGDIPIIGTLFRADDRDSSRQELLVLLTPYVLLTPEEARAETERLHTSSAAGQEPMYKGWTDSSLAEPHPDVERRKRQDDKKRLKEEQRRQREAEQRRQETTAWNEERGVDRAPANETEAALDDTGMTPAEREYVFGPVADEMVWREAEQTDQAAVDAAIEADEEKIAQEEQAAADQNNPTPEDEWVLDEEAQTQTLTPAQAREAQAGEQQQLEKGADRALTPAAASRVPAGSAAQKDDIFAPVPMN